MSDLYHKIPGLYKRQEEKPFKLIPGVYREPEIEMLKNVDWVFTEKVDGTNIRVIWDGHNVVFGGRTDNAQIPSPLVTKLNELFLGIKMEQVFEQMFGETKVILFGEGYGAKIQKGGGNYSATQEFVLFDIQINDIYLSRENVEGIAEKFGLSVVPIVFTGPIEAAVDVVKAGLTSKWGDFPAEGLVGRLPIDLLSRKRDRLIVKIKAEDFDG